MSEDQLTAMTGEIASGPGECRRVVLDKAQVIQGEGATWVYGLESGIVVKADSARECLLQFFAELNDQIDFPEDHALPRSAQSEDGRREYLNVMRLRMREAIAPAPDPEYNYKQEVEFYEGNCGLENNPTLIPLIDIDNLQF